MTWNYEMSKAPKGQTITLLYEKADGTHVERSKFVPDKIIAASDSCDTVTVTHWIPETSRWANFATNQTPLAWMPFPSHPREQE